MVILAALVAVVGTAATGARAGNAVFKCTGEQGVTYQSHPCPVGVVRLAPTVQQLNAERQRRLREQAAAGPAVSAVVQPASGSLLPGAGVRPPAPAPMQAPPGSTSLPAAGGFRCDGRTHCAQMTSCAEARYFLAHCPNVKMDGDYDGVPCQAQWCGGAGGDADRDHGRSRRR